MNEHDSENIKAMLEYMGYKNTDTLEKSDIVILNTCSIRENANNKVFGFLGRVKHLKNFKKDLIVGITGCMTQEEVIANKLLEKYKWVNFVVGTHMLDKINEEVYKSINGSKLDIIAPSIEGNIIEDLPVRRESKYKAYINIQLGCDKFCTYCIVPYTRGKQRSRHKEDILNEVNTLKNEGYKEITLLGQNVNSYLRVEREKGIEFEEYEGVNSFSTLLRAVNKIDGIERIRFVSPHPKDFTDDVIKAIADCEKVCKLVHLPLQSGNTKVLKEMNRKYTKEQYLNLVEKMKAGIPGLTLSTDIIVGFPGETDEEFEEAYKAVNPALLDVIRKALVNIESYHELQKQNSWFTSTENGTMLGQKLTALNRVGVYVPGGKAAYPSSVLMNILPAKVAGVKEICMTTPCGRDGKVNPVVLAAAKEAGADRVFKIGGAQAIAAFAYGTESIPKVDKIVGPGNIYVALAKKAVYGNVSIDSIAGPSEILVLADETANPRFVAADLLSQAEHDELASAILITTSQELAEKVSEEVDGFLKVLSRSDIISKSLDNFGYILVTDSHQEAIDTVDAIAPEHLEVCIDDPFSVLNEIKNAGSIFLGRNVPEALGDYFAGPNHTLPTSGTARFSSPLGVDDFVKKSSFLYYTREALEKAAPRIADFAEREGLHAHARSVTIRYDK